jgi:hypothetical protein
MFDAILMELVKARIMRGGELGSEVLDKLVLEAEAIESRLTVALRTRSKSRLEAEKTEKPEKR